MNPRRPSIDQAAATDRHPTRRDAIGAVIAASAATAASLASPGIVSAIEPIKRSGKQELKLSLAAYSFRQYLPNHRGGKAKANTPMDMFKFIDYCAAQKLDGAELTSYFIPHPCSAELAKKLKRRAADKGVAISGGAIGNNFAYPPGKQLDAQMAYTKRWIEAYASMGAPCIRVFAGHPRDKKTDPMVAEKRIIENLNKACAFAGEHKIKLAMENHDFTTDIDRFLRIVKAVDSPWFGANLDSGNLAKTATPYKDLARIAPYSINAQFKVLIPRDGKREPADYGKLVKVLRDGGYSGFVVLEYEDREDPKTAVPKHLDALRKALG